MYQFAKFLLELKLDRRAVTSLEYGIIGVIIVAVALVGITGVGTNVAAKMNRVKNALT